MVRKQEKVSLVLVPTVDQTSHEQTSFESSQIIPRKRTKDTFLIYLGQIQMNDRPDKEAQRNICPSDSYTLPTYQPLHNGMGGSFSSNVSLSIAHHSRSNKYNTTITAA